MTQLQQDVIAMIQGLPPEDLEKVLHFVETLTAAPKRRSLRVTNSVAPAVPGSAENRSHTLALIKNRTRQLTGDFGLVIGVRNDHEDVSLEAFVRGQVGRSLMDLSAARCLGRGQLVRARKEHHPRQGSDS